MSGEGKGHRGEAPLWEKGVAERGKRMTETVEGEIWKK